MPKLALVVEDDDDLREIFAELFEYADMNVECADNGQRALDILAESTPDVIMLDIHLPQVSGLDILKWLRANARFAHTRIIAITADALLMGVLEGQADYALTKPVEFSKLDALLTEVAR